MQSFTRRPRGRPGAPLAIGFGLLTVRACGANRSAAIPAATARRSAAVPAAARVTPGASNVAVKIAGPYAGPFQQVTWMSTGR
jgi:hypothetical protein